MRKKILLVEPAYKTKYPPLGLMKLSTYHKMKGDEVSFVKGYNSKVKYLYWDRVYISTLFTWTWEETVKTINFYHATLFKFADKCFVGGILASLMPHELYNATGIRPVEGLLDDPRKIEQNDDIVIDGLSPDYDILKQVQNDKFSYSNTDAYLGYTTRGCPRKCPFCAVSKFEPQFVHYVDIKETVQRIIAGSGEKQNLVLMDNNVLYSRKFDQIIDDIMSLGFVKGATFAGPTNRPRQRVVDFNQGLDARLLTEEKMKRLAEIPLQPMRIAFDSIKWKETYIRAVRLARKYGQRDMSNYILYNYDDTPEDFYERLRINIELNEEYRREGGVRTEIYSFPMRYIPLDAKKRDVYTGNSNWKWRYLRGLQVILNVTKGPVMPKRQFFTQAFGRDADEFKAILTMPDEFIRNRLVRDWKGAGDYDDRLAPYVKEWMDTYRQLSNEETVQLVSALGTNDKGSIQARYDKITNTRLQKLLRYHLEEDTEVAKHQAS